MGNAVLSGDAKAQKLIRYADLGRLSKVKSLVRMRADVNKALMRHCTALYAASQKGHTSVVKYLLKKNVTDENKNWGLLEAATHGHLRVCNMLLDSNADVNFSNQVDETPVHCAAKFGHCEVIKILVQHKADVNRGRKDGQTAMHLAVRGSHGAAVVVLADLGAIVDVGDKVGRVPADLASDQDMLVLMRRVSPPPALRKPSLMLNGSRRSTASGDSAPDVPPAHARQLTHGLSFNSLPEVGLSDDDTDHAEVSGSRLAGRGNTSKSTGAHVCSPIQETRAVRPPRTTDEDSDSDGDEQAIQQALLTLSDPRLSVMASPSPRGRGRPLTTVATEDVDVALYNTEPESPSAPSRGISTRSYDDDVSEVREVSNLSCWRVGLAEATFLEQQQQQQQQKQQGQRHRLMNIIMADARISQHSRSVPNASRNNASELRGVVEDEDEKEEDHDDEEEDDVDDDDDVVADEEDDIFLSGGIVSDDDDDMHVLQKLPPSKGGAIGRVTSYGAIGSAAFRAKVLASEMAATGNGTMAPSGPEPAAGAEQALAAAQQDVQSMYVKLRRGPSAKNVKSRKKWW